MTAKRKSTDTKIRKQKTPEVEQLANCLTVSCRAATKADHDLPWFDFTYANNILTCPTYGIATYHYHKVLDGDARAMALEAGGAAHEAFAALRVWQLRRQQKLVKHAQVAAVHLFGPDRCKKMDKAASKHKAGSLGEATAYTLEALYTCGFEDDPSDTRRTFDNIAEGVERYVGWYLDWCPRYPVWVADVKRADAPVGIELAFDIVVEYKHGNECVGRFRFAGVIDGIHTYKKKLLPIENKTAYRINEAWSMLFQTNHQPTGYCIPLSIIMGQPCDEVMIVGMQLPLPKEALGLHREIYRRPVASHREFFSWLFDAYSKWLMYKDNLLDAPMYTHSCGRYNRPCSLIPFCSQRLHDRDAAAQMFRDMDVKPPDGGFYVRISKRVAA